MNSKSLGCGGFIAVALLVILSLIVSYAGATYHDHVATCIVTGKDRVSTGTSGSSDARVYTKQCDTLRVADSFWLGLHNSSNIYGGIQSGHTYRLRISGWRLGWTSSFPRIVAVNADLGTAGR